MNRRGFLTKLLHLGALAVVSPLVKPFVPQRFMPKLEWDRTKPTLRLELMPLPITHATFWFSERMAVNDAQAQA